MTGTTGKINQGWSATAFIFCASFRRTPQLVTGGLKPKPKNGEMVKVHYTGMLLNGEVFDSSYSRNMPIEFVLGAGRVIKGWDEGISLIPIGASAKLVIPSDLAYGERGAGGVIPPNSTLIFEIEVIDSKK